MCPSEATRQHISQLSRLQGIGIQTVKHLARLNIYSVDDLLLHLPSRYQDRTHIESMNKLMPDENVVIEGIIQSVIFPSRGRTKLLCELSDGKGTVLLRFFHVLAFQKQVLKQGNRIRCFAEVRLGPKGFEMVHPEFQKITEGKEAPIDQHLTPIYPATEGISQYTLRKITRNALMWLTEHPVFDEILPLKLMEPLSFPTLKVAIQQIHRPPCEVAIDDLLAFNTSAQKRLIFEELLAHRISLLKVKQSFQSQFSIALKKSVTLANHFLQQLPFTLTNGQKRVITEIQEDLMRPHPMLRLVQGDVGSGKTVVAALAMLQAIENGYQAAIMAPTELLAEQHYRIFKRWLVPLGIKVVFLSGNVKASARKEALSAIQEGHAQVTIGTHALFQGNVQFAKLALIIVDEQHRFGVHQRALFREKGQYDDYQPHQLMMTATPIPRTLSMSFYADLDVSVIDELPPGRTPITTTLMTASRRNEVIARTGEAIKQGRQVYWVCPLIDESEHLNCQAATQTAEELQQCLPGLTIGLIHGRMKASEKESVMRAFQAGEIQLLVATTVIEVGVDVPNASVMIIENAERLGLSQLHQLRGRVGRGKIASYCILLYQYPLSNLAKERLKVMRETTDGFKIAERDLELRGPGEILGTRQTGELSFKVANLMRDSELLTIVQQTADSIIHDFPDSIEPLVKRWLGDAFEYGKV